MSAKSCIKHGNEFPFDAPDAFWSGDAPIPPAPKDWAHSAARGIIADLQDRGGIKHELSTDRIAEATRAEIVAAIAEIIRKAQP